MSTITARLRAAVAAQWPRRAQASVTLDLPYPVSTNRLWQKGLTGLVRTPTYATWFRAAGNRLNEQHPGKVKGEYELTVLLGKPDRRKRDLDNTIKSLSDLLVEHGIIDDDSFARKITLEWSSDVTGARVTVTALAADRRAA